MEERLDVRMYVRLEARKRGSKSEGNLPWPWPGLWPGLPALELVMKRKGMSSLQMVGHGAGWELRGVRYPILP